MKGLILVSMLVVALGCLATADAQELPVTQPGPIPTVAQGGVVPVPQVLLVPRSRVVCVNGNCQQRPQQQAMRPSGGYVFTRGILPWRVRYSSWSR